MYLLEMMWTTPWLFHVMCMVCTGMPHSLWNGACHAPDIASLDHCIYDVPPLVSSSTQPCDTYDPPKGSFDAGQQLAAEVICLLSLSMLYNAICWPVKSFPDGAPRLQPYIYTYAAVALNQWCLFGMLG